MLKCQVDLKSIVMDCQSLEGALIEDRSLSLWEEQVNNLAASTKGSLRVAVSKEILTVAL